MKLLAILAVTIAVVRATTIPPQTTPESTESSLLPVEDDSDNGFVIPSASVGDVEVAAVVQEVEGDWHYPEVRSISLDGDDSEDVDEEEEEVYEEDEHDEGVYNDYEELEARIEKYDYEEDFAGAATQEAFEANVPTAIHGNKDVIINKDNFIPILKTIVLAYTHKDKPSYSDILKAGGVSAFKTGFKFFGKENLGGNLLKMAKKLTGAFGDEDSDGTDDELLAELAEAYLSSRRFKLVLPESVLLHQKEMDEFMSKREVEEIEGRSHVSSKQFDISMPRTDPAVQTILTVGPMTWMALIGGLFSIPYLFSGTSDSEPARVDHVTPNLSPYLRPPGLPFFNTHQLRRDENEQVPHQHIDQEYLEYQKSYDQWYKQWYLRYKNYYDEYYPNHQQPHPSTLQHQAQSVAQQQPHPATLQHQAQFVAQQQPHPSIIQHQAHLAAPFDLTPPPPFNAEHAKEHPQKPFHPPQKPLPPKQQLPKQPPPIQFNSPIHPQVPVAPAHSPRLDSGRNAGANIVSAENKENTFGTFQSEENKADSHFKVIQGPEVAQAAIPTPTTSRPRSKVPNPQPVYIPNIEAPKAERGFKPITKPNSSTVKPSTTPSTKTDDQFRAPKDETLVSSKSPSKPKVQGAPETVAKTSGGFKPIPAPADAAGAKKEDPTQALKISAVTSGVFKTSTSPTPAKAVTPETVTTSRPAVFVRTDSQNFQKSVRVVTSSSVVVPGGPGQVRSESVQQPLPELKRPQRNQQSNPSSFQQISNQVKTQQPLPVHQRLPLQQQQPAISQLVQQQAPAVQQQTQPAVQQPRPPVQQPQPRPPVQQPRPAVQQQTRPAVQQPRPAAQQQGPTVQQLRPVQQQQQQQVPAVQQQTRPAVQQPRPAVQQQGPTVQQLRPVQQQTFQQQPAQLAQAGGAPRPNEQNTGFVRTNVPTFVKVVDHRPAQGFGLGTKPAPESTTTTTTTPMPIYALDPFYGSRLSRTDVIFHQLGVEDEGCREQVVCNIYKNPDVYTPYSDFLSRQLTVKLEELQRPKVSDERILRFFRYLKAARDGQDGSDCVSKYPDCHIDTAQLSYKPIMNAFQKVSLLMNAGSS